MEEITKTQSVNINEPIATKDPFSFFSTNWKYNIVEDVNAPLLYSRQVIYTFSCLFSVIFGGILLSVNLKRVNRMDGIREVLAYSVAYTTTMFVILSQFQRNTLLVLLISMAGSFALYNYFWKKYIGLETKYRTRPFFIPLMIGLVIMAIIFLMIF
jgi:hypothetical protein